MTMTDREKLELIEQLVNVINPTGYPDEKHCIGASDALIAAINCIIECK